MLEKKYIPFADLSNIYQAVNFNMSQNVVLRFIFEIGILLVINDLVIVIEDAFTLGNKDYFMKFKVYHFHLVLRGNFNNVSLVVELFHTDLKINFVFKYNINLI